MPCWAGPPATKSDSTLSLEIFREKYALADRLSKLLSVLTEEAAIPAVNELRYAGFHLLKATNASGSVEDGEHLTRAIEHCERAIYDATEAGILASVQNIDRVLSSYGLVTIPNIVPTLPEIRQARAAAVEMLIANRTGSLADRVGIFEELLQHSRTLELAKPDLDKEATLASTRRFRSFVALGLTATGALSALAALAALL